MNINSDAEKYIAAHISPEPEHLHRLFRQTHLKHLYPRMCSGHVQGRLLKMLAAMINPGNVLELGTYTGYSTLCIAEGMTPPGRIITVEIDDEMADELTHTFSSLAPQGIDIELIVGDALDIIPTFADDLVFDLVFIDANKRHYTQYFNLVLEHVRPGGFIIADNTLWDGKIFNSVPSDSQSLAIAQFNDTIAADSRVEKIILPVRDGMTIMRRTR